MKAEGLEYSKDWEKAHWPIVNAALYGVRRPETDADSFLKAAKMRPLWRMFYNLLFHIVFARRGGKDNVKQEVVEQPEEWLHPRSPKEATSV